MSVQMQVTRQSNKISNRARMVAFSTLDAATERVIESARKASERGASVSADAERFLSQMDA